MATIVSVEDVENRLLGTTFTDAESMVIGLWIEDLENEIRGRWPDLSAKAAQATFLANLKRAITAAIKRVLDNPKGRRQLSVTIDDYTRSETIDSSASAGLLYLSADDWNLLAPALDGDAFSIRTVATPGFAEYP